MLSPGSPLYPTGCTHYVRTAASRSVSIAVLFGVPQGSVLGPILLLLYVADLLQLVKRHGLHPHCYADNNQMYGFSDPSDVDALQESLSVCIDEVFSWMMSNWLQLNPAKTEVIWCYSLYVSIRPRLVLFVLVTLAVWRSG